MGICRFYYICQPSNYAMNTKHVAIARNNSLTFEFSWTVQRNRIQGEYFSGVGTKYLNTFLVKFLLSSIGQDLKNDVRRFGIDSPWRSLHLWEWRFKKHLHVAFFSYAYHFDCDHFPFLFLVHPVSLGTLTVDAMPFSIEILFRDSHSWASLCPNLLHLRCVYSLWILP